jgi:hypothetical protein
VGARPDGRSQAGIGCGLTGHALTGAPADSTDVRAVLRVSRQAKACPGCARHPETPQTAGIVNIETAIYRYCCDDSLNPRVHFSPRCLRVGDRLGLGPTVALTLRGQLSSYAARA